MEVDFSALYNREIASAISLLQELIIDVNNELMDSNIKTKWDRVGDINGYYFNIVNPKEKRDEISFGIWNDLWEDAGSPLCLTFQMKEFSSSEVFKTVSEFIELNNIENTQVIKINETIALVFTEHYLIEVKYIQEIVNLIIAFIQEFSFDINIVRKKW